MYSEQVFTLDELEFVADLCKRHDVIVFSDEVYEWLVYKPKKHIRIGRGCSYEFSLTFENSFC